MDAPTRLTVCVIGLGYIGLPTAAVLAQAGHNVIGVDIQPESVSAVNGGQVPFVESGLEAVVAGMVAKGRLSAQAMVPSADVFIVTVPTPFARSYQADLSYIDAAARDIAPALRGGELVVLESTSPPGTTARMADLILQLRSDLTDKPNQAASVYFSHAPERVLPGRIMIEMVENDRIIGGTTPEASERTKALYSTFCRGTILVTDARTAELAKLTENAYRDVNIAFANELSIVADRQGVDVWELIELANHHPRVDILQPGPGVGGHCIAVDPWFIVSAEPEHTKLISAARDVNNSKPQVVLDKVLERSREFRTPTVAILGIAFKADVDDLRNSPSKDISLLLAEQLSGGTILIVEPHINSLPTDYSKYSNVALASLEEAIDCADIVLVLVDHSPFRHLERDLLQDKIVIDTKGIWR